MAIGDAQGICVTHNNVCKNTVRLRSGKPSATQTPQVYLYKVLSLLIYLSLGDFGSTQLLFTSKLLHLTRWHSGGCWGKCSLGQSSPRRSSWSLRDTAQQWAVGILSLAPGSRFPCSTVRLSWVRRGNFFLNFVCIHTGRPNVFGLDW